MPIIFRKAFDEPKMRAHALRSARPSFSRKPFDDTVLIAAMRAAAGEAPSILRNPSRQNRADLGGGRFVGVRTRHALPESGQIG